MKIIRLIVFFLSICFLYACNNNKRKIEYARIWSNEVKNRIIEQSSQIADSVFNQKIDSSIEIITTFKKGKILKRIRRNPRTNEILGTVFFSSDQNFVLGRELCPLLKDEFVEVILYKKITMGLHTFYYCDGKIKKQGFNVHGYVGIWNEYNDKGEIIKSIDYRNINLLDTLRIIGYPK